MDRVVFLYIAHRLMVHSMVAMGVSGTHRTSGFEKAVDKELDINQLQ